MSKKIIKIEEKHSFAIKRLMAVRISRFIVQFMFLFIANLGITFFLPLPIVGLTYPWSSFISSFDLLQISIVLLIPPILPLATVAIFNVTIGRFFCGWLCPFGFVQDLIGYITRATRFISSKTDARLKNFKYFVLFMALIVTLGLASLNSTNVLETFRSTYGRGVGIMPYSSLAPDATLLGTIPFLFNLGVLPSSFEKIFSSLNFGLAVRYFFLFLILILIARVSRFYCRYICPMGALNAIFSAKSFIGIYRDVGTCDTCGLCSKICPVQIDVEKAKIGRIDGKECIMCLECVAACHTRALRISFKR
jgi:polyferredoxin